MASTFTQNKINKINQIISENIDDPIFIINEKLVCEYANFEDFKEEKHIIDFIHPNDSKNVSKLIKNIFKFGYGNTTSRIKSDMEQFRWYEIKGKRIVEDHENKAILICKDITKYKDIEREIKQSQTRYTQLADSLPEIKYWKLLQSKEGITAVQKSREMLELVINNIPQLIYWKDKDLVYLGCNSNFAKLNGLENPTSIIGRTGDNLNWIKDKSNHIEECERKVITNNEPEYNVLESLITTDVNQVWFEINRIPLHDIKGKVVGILSTYEDITIRKIADQRLKESEEKYRGILENIKETYFEVDIDGAFTFFNDSFIDLIGYQREELLGVNYQKFVDEENKNKILGAYAQVLETGQPKSNFQFQFRNKNGNIATCESSVYLRHNINGKIVGFSGIARDITEKFQLEQKLKDSEEELKILNEELEQIVFERTKELRESEEKFRTIAEQTSLGIAILQEGYVIYTNQALSEITGYSTLKRFIPMICLMF